VFGANVWMVSNGASKWWQRGKRYFGDLRVVNGWCLGGFRGQKRLVMGRACDNGTGCGVVVWYVENLPKDASGFVGWWAEIDRLVWKCATVARNIAC
jgi:hypothetical protein